MIQLWTISNIQRLPNALRKKVTFYAPLVESLDFYGVEPFTYSWVGSTSATYRGGTFIITAPAPIFHFSDENTPDGLLVSSGFTFRFAAENGLNNSNTLIWFETRVPKSTPTNTNPFDTNGNWTGNIPVYVSHIVKANTVLTNAEINQIQQAVLDVPPQVIPEPEPPPSASIGTFVEETPAGAIGQSVFTLSQTPDLGSLEIFWAGLYLKRVPSAPQELEYTASGSGNRTITMGSVLQSGQDLTAKYVTS